MIVVAMPEELALVDSRHDTALVTGAGAQNVIRSLADIDRDTPIFNVGYAGGNKLEVGSRVRVGKVGFYHPIAGAISGETERLLDGNVPCYTSGDFVENADIQEPCVFDMELAYILALGFTNVSAEKVVSDNLSKKEFEECLKK